jgi:hypothetical protein
MSPSLVIAKKESWYCEEKFPLKYNYGEDKEIRNSHIEFAQSLAISLMKFNQIMPKRKIGVTTHIWAHTMDACKRASLD